MIEIELKKHQKIARQPKKRESKKIFRELKKTEVGLKNEILFSSKLSLGWLETSCLFINLGIISDYNSKNGGR